jgi:CRP/FNR family cyclic AMP-dependent transcriptional regulator
MAAFGNHHGRTNLLSIAELRQHALWTKALTSEECERVAEESFDREVGAGTHVASLGAPVLEWNGILDGLVKMSVDTPEGRTSSFTGISKGGWFGEGSLLKHELRRYDIVALRSTRIACVPRFTFERLVDTSLAFNRFLIDQLNARLSLFIGMVEHDRLLDADARVARCIAGLFEPQLYPGAEPTVDITQQELGHLCGLSRQRTNRALRGLQEQGVISSDFHTLKVLNLRRLRGYSSRSALGKVPDRSTH